MTVGGIASTAVARRHDDRRSASGSGTVDPVASLIDSLPSYEPRGRASGTISLWGHGSFKRDFLGRLVQAWTEEFKRSQPDVAFEYRMYGTASAIGALYTGVGDLAILGEEIHPDAAAAFVRARQYAPTGIQIATGSLDVSYYDYAHMIFVHRDNPLRNLTLGELEGIFGTGHRRGSRNIRTWDQLGLAGEWRGQRIQPYCWKLDEDFALFFREAVLHGSHRWNVDIREFVHVSRPDGSIYEHGQQILDTLAQDRFGIGVSNLRYANERVRPLALARNDGGPYYEAMQENLVLQRYPLTRIIPAFIDRAPGRPIEPKLREFLRYILSREGQRALVSYSAYLPLSPDVIRRELERLQ